MAAMVRHRETGFRQTLNVSHKRDCAQEPAEQERERIEAALFHEAQLRQRAEQAEQAAEQERLRAERLVEMLRQLGHDPDQV